MYDCNTVSMSDTTTRCIMPKYMIGDSMISDNNFAMKIVFVLAVSSFFIMVWRLKFLGIRVQ